VALFAALVAFTGVFLVYFYRCNKGGSFSIRRIPGISAIDEAIGRCTEMGRPVHYCFGIGKFDSSVVASLEVLAYVAKRCAEMSTQIIVSNSQPEVHPIAEEIVRHAFDQAGKKDLFRPDNMRFLTNDAAYIAGIYGILLRENPGANLMIGPFAADSLSISEMGNRLGIVQIAGTSATVQTPFFVATCDYTLLGDELFVAQAYLSREPREVALVLAQDVAKMTAIVLILASTIMVSFGNKWLPQLLVK
jgi:hypothetical protein